MKIMSVNPGAVFPLCLLIFSCSSNPGKSDLGKEIVGKYASSSENEYDYFKDTIEIKANDEGKFDLTFVARWSAAKADDPQRPVNKVAGQWNNHGKGETFVADLQASDTTLRISDPFGGASVIIVPLNLNDGTLDWTLTNGTKKTYNKVD